MAIQRRLSLNSIDFWSKTWDEYKNGFGNVHGEYWLGNDDIHALTSQRGSEMLVWFFLESFSGEYRNVIYKGFRVENEANNYKLHTGVYSAGKETISSKSILKHDQMLFSTPERENDIHQSQNCASRYKSGFWFSNCYGATPNGAYGDTESLCKERGIHWIDWKGTTECMRQFRILIRKLPA